MFIKQRKSSLTKKAKVLVPSEAKLIYYHYEQRYY